MKIEHSLVSIPFFSICIPQYNRTSFLLETLRSLTSQTFKNFEVCISDDCSTDGREEELLQFLKGSGIPFVYHKQTRNVRYDANLRSSIALARGKFCFLLGNDDCLASSTTLEDLYNEINRFGSVGVVITNFENFVSGKEVRRVRQSLVTGSGPQVAASHFRNFSFVSGIILDTQEAQKHTTSKWDGSEMYQMFIGCRMITEGTSLLGLNKVVIRQGVHLPGQKVDSYASKPRLNPCPILERRLPLGELGRLVVDAITPAVSTAEKGPITRKIFLQILLFTYPFWIFEYRRVQSWKFALGVCLGMRPKNILSGLPLSFFSKIYLGGLYLGVTFLGLITPLRLFDILYPALYTFAKSYSNVVQRGSGTDESVVLSKVS